MTELKKYNCKFCDKEYETYMGLWKHIKNKHKNTTELLKENKIIEINQICKSCKKTFSHSKNRWRHEKFNCKVNKLNNSEITNITNNIQTQNNITNNITNIQNNNTINISFNALGCEDVSILTQEQIEEVINKGLGNIIKLVEFLNFNEKHPQNHTYCTTNLNTKYLSALNTETNEIEKKNKDDIFDNVVRYALNHCDMLKEYITDKHKKSIFSDRIQDLENKFPLDIKCKKYYHALNVLSYNKRKLVQNTWDEKLKEILNI
jgi:hypothetical protein